MDRKKAFIEKSTLKHGNKYDYSKVEYVNARTKVTIVCPKHGDFEQQPYSHQMGCGCPNCANATRNKHLRLTQDQVINQFREKHGCRYDYSKVDYINIDTKVTILCKKHGPFEQTPYEHRGGQGCPNCNSPLTLGNNFGYNNKSFKKAARRVHGSAYSYKKVDYVSAKVNVTIICRKHGDFEQTPDNHLAGHGCRKCKTGYTISQAEKDLLSFIRKHFPTAEHSNRTILNGKELDIYIPEKKIAIELNGTYWHSSRFKDNDYHWRKTKQCADQGIRLIHIWDTDWNIRRSTVKRTLKHILGVSDLIGNARDCFIVQLPLRVVRDFYQRHHIQGSPIKGTTYCLLKGKRILAAMTFCSNQSHRGRSVSGEWELIRFASSGNIRGAASRLLTHFERDYVPTTITSYSDNLWFSGGLYQQLGFTHLSDVPYDYKTLWGNILRHKSYTRKNRLSKLFDNYDPNQTELDNCIKNNIYRVYDAGKKKWVKHLNKRTHK
ncbi:hypothetical protein GR11A_00081 [Vibrio phage vB_VcorM_GR11A]|nr:hypothetical protein GR11A_00081 [Vibrio phage vB_VcorM_GR11A]